MRLPIPRAMVAAACIFERGGGLSAPHGLRPPPEDILAKMNWDGM